MNLLSLDDTSVSDLIGAIGFILRASPDLLPVGMQTDDEVTLSAEQADEGLVARRWMRRFQASADLSQTGAPDAESVAFVNRLLLAAADAVKDGSPANIPRLIRVALVDAAGAPVVDGVVVRLFDRDFGIERTPIGEPLTTDPEGNASVRYDWGPDSELVRGDTGGRRGRADVVIEVFEPHSDQPLQPLRVIRRPVTGDGSLTSAVVVEGDELRLGIEARDIEDIVVVAPWTVPLARREALFDRIARELASLGVSPLELREDPNLDVSYAAREIDVPFEVMADFVASHQPYTGHLGELFIGVPVATFFGLRIVGGLRSAADIAGTPAPKIAEFLKVAIDRDLIRRVDGLHDVVPKIITGSAEAALREPPGSGGTAVPDAVRQLDTSLANVDLTGMFAQVQGSLAATPGDFWQRFNSEHADLPGGVDRVQYAVQQMSLALGSLPIAEALRTAFPDAISGPSLTRLFDPQQFRSAIPLDAGADLPAAFADEPPEARVERHVERIAATLDVTYPVAAMSREIRRTHPGEHALACARVLDGLDDQTAHTISTEPIRNVLARSPELIAHVDDDIKPAVVDELARLQRLYSVSADAASFAALTAEPSLLSAYDVARLSKPAFLRRFGQPGTPQFEAMSLTFERASAIGTSLVLAIAQAANQSSSPQQVGGPAPADSAPPAAGNAPPAAPATPPAITAVLDDFSGAGHAHQCEHCRSVLSPAAYFVNLLEYLQWRTNAPTGIRDLLIGSGGRRPDLAHIPLTCEHTETPIPYIDLVNEILEARVSEITIVEASSSPAANSANLKAQPEHIELKAYERLRATATDPSLPFDLATETANASLSIVGTSPAQLLRLIVDQPTTQLGDTFERRLLAARILGLGPLDWLIITNEQLGDDPLTSPAPETLFGFAAATPDWSQQLTTLPTLLARTGLTFSELDELLRSALINPNRDDAAAQIPEYVTRGLRSLPMPLDQLHAFNANGFTGLETDKDLAERMLLASISIDDLKSLAATITKSYPQILVVDPATADNAMEMRLRRIGSDAPGSGQPTAEDWVRIHRAIRLHAKSGLSLATLDGLLSAVRPADATTITSNQLCDLADLVDSLQDVDVTPKVIASLVRRVGPTTPLTELVPQVLPLPIGGTLSDTDVLGALGLSAADADALKDLPTGPRPWTDPVRAQVGLQARTLAAAFGLDVPVAVRLLTATGTGALTAPMTAASLRHAIELLKLASTFKPGAARFVELTSPDLTTAETAMATSVLENAQRSIAELTGKLHPNLTTSSVTADPATARAAAAATVAVLIASSDPADSTTAHAQAEADLLLTALLERATVPLATTPSLALPTSAGGPLWYDNTDPNALQVRRDPSLEGDALDRVLTLAAALTTPAIRPRFAALRASNSISVSEPPVLAFGADPTLEIHHTNEAGIPTLVVRGVPGAAGRAFLTSLTSDADFRNAVSALSVPELERIHALSLLGGNNTGAQPQPDLSIGQVEERAGSAPQIADFLAPSALRVLAPPLVSNLIGSALSLPVENALVTALAARVVRVTGLPDPDVAELELIKLELIRLSRISALLRSLGPRLQSPTVAALVDVAAQATAGAPSSAQKLFLGMQRFATSVTRRATPATTPDPLFDVVHALTGTELIWRSVLPSFNAATGSNFPETSGPTADAALAQLDRWFPLSESWCSLERLQRFVAEASSAGLDPTDALLGALDPDANRLSAQGVAAIQRKYPTAVLDKLGQMNDTLRERRRDALVTYLLRLMHPDVADPTPDLLFAELLIDVEMSSCQLTSRIKQAISTVQLFVQRILLGQEDHGPSPLPPSTIDAEDWESWKSYRVQEANLRVFLDPGKYTIPAVRDDKTPLFKDLEAALVQSDPTPELTEQLVANYLAGLSEIADLDVCAIHLENNPSPPTSRRPYVAATHLIGRTKGSAAGLRRNYYHRTRLQFQHSTEWTPWERIGVEIDASSGAASGSEGIGIHIAAVLWDNDLHLFWATARRERTEPDGTTGLSLNDGEGSLTAPQPLEFWRIKLHWTRRRNGRWEPKQTGDRDGYILERSGKLVDLKALRLTATPRNRALHVSLDAPSEINVVGVTFRFAAPNEDMTVQTRTPPRPAPPRPKRTAKIHYAKVDEITVSKIEDQKFVKATGPSIASEFNLAPISAANESASLTFFDFSLHASGSSNEFQFERIPGALTLEALYMDTTPLTTSGASPRVLWESLASTDRDKVFVFNDDRLAFLADVSPHRSFRVTPALAPPPIPSPGTLPADAGALVDELASVASPPVWSLNPWAGIQIKAIRELTNPTGDAMNLPAAQIAAPILIKAAPSVTIETTDDVAIDAQPISHPLADTWLHLLNHQSIRDLWSLETQRPPTKPFHEILTTTYGASPGLVRAAARDAVDFHTDAAYSAYNAELFLHVPLLAISHLLDAGQPAAALRIGQLLFDWTRPATPATADQGRWRVAMLTEPAGSIYDTILSVVNSPTAAAVASLAQLLEVSQRFPFQPHRLARLRPDAYKRYIIDLLARIAVTISDRDAAAPTLERRLLAPNGLMLARAIAPPRPVRLPARPVKTALTYDQLLPLIKRRSELLAGAQSDLTGATLATPQPSESKVVLGALSNGYFCLPQNTWIDDLHDLIDDRLFKIRHCLDLEGNRVELPLFEPPIDPALLVAATAAGLSIGQILDDMSAPEPTQRFTVLLRRALELAGELKSLEANLLSTIERREAEHLANLRANQETELLDLVDQVLQRRIREAQENTRALIAARNVSEQRWAHLKSLLGDTERELPPIPTGPTVDETLPAAGTELVSTIGQPYAAKRKLVLEPVAAPDLGMALASVSPIGGALAAIASPGGGSDGALVLREENRETASTMTAVGLTIGSAASEVLAVALSAIPMIETAAKPMGMGTGFHYGGINLSQAASATGRVLSAGSSIASTYAAMASRQAAQVLREHEWAAQLNQTELDIVQTDQRLVASRVVEAIALKEYDRHTKQRAHADDIRTFLTERKVANEALYAKIEADRQMLHREFFDIVKAAAKQTERALKWEVNDPVVDNEVYVKPNIWDPDQRGLQAGERISVALRRMESDFLAARRRRPELTKHMSLRLLDPVALLELRSTGTCEFEIPEVLFDLDHPGQYLRRIARASLSIPCVTGPYTGVPATLTLVESKTRRSPDKEPAVDLARPETLYLSSSNNDSGTFDATARDDLYLPFEGRGVISKWRVELPQVARPIDYASISDLILHLQFTAFECSETRRSTVEAELAATVSELRRGIGPNGVPIAVSVRHDTPDLWHKLVRSTALESAGLPDPTAFLPLWARGFTVQKAAAHVILVIDPNDTDLIDSIAEQAVKGHLGPSEFQLTQSPIGPHLFEASTTTEGSGLSVPLDVSTPLTLDSGPSALVAGGALIPTSVKDLLVVLTIQLSDR